MAFNYTFPADLIALRREFIQAGRELQDLPNGGDREQRRGELRDRERGLAVKLSGHPYWQEYDGDLTQAKFALHQVAVDGLDAADERDEDIWAGAGPWARVTLPRGQVIRVIVTGRRRVKTAEGRSAWWYEVETLLWMRSRNLDGTSRAEQGPVTFGVPAELLEPIGGQDYAGVPTMDELLPRPWWLQIYLRPEPGGAESVLHRKGCGRAPNPSLPMTDEEAVDAVKEGGVVPCALCKPNTAPLWLKYPPRPGK